MESEKKKDSYANVTKTDKVPMSKIDGTDDMPKVRGPYNPQKTFSNSNMDFNKKEYAKKRMSQIQAYVHNKEKSQKNTQMFSNIKNTLSIEMSETDIKVLTENMIEYKREYEEYNARSTHFEKTYLHKLDPFQYQILWRALFDKKIESIPQDEAEIRRFKQIYDRIPTLEKAIADEGEYY